MAAVRACFVALSVLLIASCGGGDDRAGGQSDTGVSSTATTSTSTPMTSAPMTTAASSDPNEAAALSFIDAWRRGDADAMRQLGEADQVEAALSYGTAMGEPDCTTQPNGQYQCVVGVTSGTRAYFLVGEPGDVAGRVWYVLEYVPGS